MPTVFVDTAAWLALVNIRDEWHTEAKQRMAELHDRHFSLVTTEFVLLEVANALCAAAWRDKAVKLIDGLRHQPKLQSSKLTLQFWRRDGDSIHSEWTRIGVSQTA